MKLEHCLENVRPIYRFLLFGALLEPHGDFNYEEIWAVNVLYFSDTRKVNDSMVYTPAH